MSRQDDFPVPHEHQFYRTTLKGLFSLDLRTAGTFWSRSRSGFQNLDKLRLEEARERRLLEVNLDGGVAYRLPDEERIQRIAALFRGLSRLAGGAKQGLHYTDVSPSLLIMAVARGGNHLFSHCVTADSKGLPAIQTDALAETLQVFRDQIRSPLYVGWPRGYLGEQREPVLARLHEAAGKAEVPLVLGHPRTVLESLADLQRPENREWLV